MREFVGLREYNWNEGIWLERGSLIGMVEYNGNGYICLKYENTYCIIGMRK